jgi:hypothetical protein
VDRFVDRWYRRDDPDRPTPNFEFLPATKPAIGGIEVDGDGYLWASAYPTPGWAESWDVYDSAGVYLGPVGVPEGLRVVEIGKDYVLGYVRDRDEINRIMVYRLTRDRRSAVSPQ